MKKVWLVVWMALFTLIGAGVVSAEETSYELGVYASSVKYEEPDFMENEGYMGGIFGAITVRKDDMGNWPNMYQFEGDIGYGQVDYTSGATGSIDGIDDWKFETRYFVGYDIPMGTDLLVTPYAGLGYRYLNDDSSGMASTTGAYGYERESNYVYLPIGVQFRKEISSEWEIGASFEFDWLLYGKQISHLEDVGPAYGQLKNEQTDGYGARGSFRVIRRGETFDFLVEPFVRWWDIEDSDTSIGCGTVFCVYGYEPKNESLEAGAKMGVIF